LTQAHFKHSTIKAKRNSDVKAIGQRYAKDGFHGYFATKQH
jgi:hypothetical protein